LRKTSAVRFTFEYPIRFPIFENKVKNGEQQTEIKDVTPKTIKIENDKCFNVEIDGDNVRVIFNTFIKIENDKCFNVEIDGDNVRVIFNTFFGSAYVHNVLTLNTDWFEEEFLNLDGYAAATYRRFFVTGSGNKFDQLAIKDLVDYFGFMKNSYYPAVVEKAFGDIKNAGLISDYKVVVNGGKFSKGYIEVKK
jgi:mRNA-degrading endonuclease HigB of HigAB toxin-antitoxin module